MTQVGAVDYAAGPNGGSITPANTPGLSNTQFGTSPLFSADIPPDYTTAAYSAAVNTTVASYNNIDWAASSLAWLSWYFKLPATPGSDSYFMGWFDGAGARIGDLRFNAGATTLLLRDNFGSVLAASAAIPVGEWHRVSLMVQPGSATGHQLRLYLGANRHGSTPSYDSGGLPATAAARTSVARWRFGFISGTGVDYKIARQRVDSAVEPPPISVPTVADTFWLDAGGLWKPTTTRHISPTGWV